MTDPGWQARVETLREQGRHAEAAELCMEAGQWTRAAELYAAVWHWSEALDAAEHAGRYDLAYRISVDASRNRDAAQYIERLGDAPEQAEQAARVAESKSRLADAARLRELQGDVDRAAEQYESAGELFDAARCHELAGRHRQAGVLYEKRVRQASWDTEAALRLGRLLAQFGRYEHAVRALQRAAEDPQRAGGALRLMVACFDAMGMGDAAARCLDRLRAQDAALPVTVAEYLQESFGDPQGLSALSAGREDADRLLAGRYRVLRSLGAGATGRVMLAHDDFYDRSVAVKVLTVGAGNAGRDAYARFAREARVAAALQHPNVVRVFEYNPEGPLLVMEHMAGGTLDERLAAQDDDALSRETIRHVVLSLLRGLEAVHRRGIVHRDLKPANVFFGVHGEVKIGDFGVAHLADLGATLTGAMIGTLAYMAPEQITGSEPPDASTDLYAFGVLLFRMLTGHLPFPGPDFVTQHLEQQPPAPSELAPQLGTEFDPLLQALLAKELGERPKSAAEVRERTQQLPWEHVPTSSSATLPAEPTGPSRPPTSAPPPPDERYALLQPLPDGAWRARDSVLDRIVQVIPCDEARARRLKELAASDSPHLQAIYEVDPEQQRAVLEHPGGTPLPDTQLEPEQRRQVEQEIRAALRSLHDAGRAHGALEARRVLVGRTRAVLLLPTGEQPGSAEQDLQALESLIGPSS